MITIPVGDVVAASLAAAGACLACSIPAQVVRKFPLWAYQTYGRGALLIPMLAIMVGTMLVSLALDGQIDTGTGLALVAAAAFLGLVLASAVLRFWLSHKRKP
ncbi:hypothetical protein [Cupriavidus campinensis]